VTEFHPPHPTTPGARPVAAWVPPTVAALVSGALLAACFGPRHLHFLAWVALVPWLVVLPRVPAERAWLFGLLLGLVFYRVRLDWLCRLHGPLGTVTIVLLAVWLGFAFRVVKLLIDRCSAYALLWAAPLAFTAQEVIRCERLPRLRFGYLAFGYSQSANLWVAQLASLGGVYFVTFLLVAVNAALAYALLRRRWRALWPVGAVASATLVLGYAAQPSAVVAEREVGVACVQTEGYDTRPLVELTGEALYGPPPPAFVVLPEHSIIDFADEQQEAVQALGRLARASGATICVGAHVRAPRHAPCDYDNVALFIGPDGRILGRQAKAVPIPFFVDGNPAERQETFATPFGRVGACLCYDADFTDVSRRLVDRGAELLLVPVMNPADWPSGQRRQQADLAPFRSIETRRWAVRAASSGISQIVGPDGRVHGQRLQDEGPGLLVGRATCRAERTVFVRGGHAFAPIVGVAYLIVVAGLTAAEWRIKLRRRGDQSAASGGT
jgi:apolipoprotein N-acyltransferase